MAQLDLVGSIQCEIDHVYAITCTKLTVKGTRPVTVKYGAQGAIGSARGQEKVTISITLAVPKTGLEFDLLGTMERPGGFTFSFPVGAERHSVYGCLRTDRSLSNTMEAGDTEFSLDATGTDWVRTR